MIQPDNKEAAHALSPEEVADFLTHHPNFFLDRDDLLMSLTLPHKRGEAVSLVERQVALLRSRSEQDRDHLDNLTSTALDNEKTYERMRQLILRLLESKDLEQAVEAVNDSLAHDFNINFHSLILFSEKPLPLPVRIESIDTANQALGPLIKLEKPISGEISDRQLAFLFPEHIQTIGSAAAIPLTYTLNHQPVLGILALAQRDAKHFRPGVGIVFLQYLGDVLSRILAQKMD